MTVFMLSEFLAMMGTYVFKMVWNEIHDSDFKHDGRCAAVVNMTRYYKTELFCFCCSLNIQGTENLFPVRILHVFHHFENNSLKPWCKSKESKRFLSSSLGAFMPLWDSLVDWKTERDITGLISLDLLPGCSHSHGSDSIWCAQPLNPISSLQSQMDSSGTQPVLSSWSH